jgi:hypothetical protein
MNDRDFAVVVGINSYEHKREFEDLEGPTNDAEELICWLKDPQGGGIPEENVDPYVQLSSSGRDRPTASDIQGRLRDLFTRDHPEDQPIGRRLYVFLAGHGFTNSVTLSLLHSVETRRLAPAFVSGTQWLDCFQERALFDELVLCMDCCRDYEPAFDPPGRPCTNQLDSAANAVKRLYLLATGIGRGAYEQDFGGKVHGLFSRALIDALREDAIDGDGRMTAANVVNSVRETLKPAAIAGLNVLPEPVVTDGFVLFDNLTPRYTGVDIKSTDRANTITLFAGSDDDFAHPIAPLRVEGDTQIFSLPRGKTYLAFANSAASGTVRKHSFVVKKEPLALEI